MKVNISHIGKTLYPKDNSYCIFIHTNERATPANNRGEIPSPVKILSVPFTTVIESFEFTGKHEFVLVEYQGSEVRIINSFFDNLEHAEKSTEIDKEKMKPIKTF